MITRPPRQEIRKRYSTRNDGFYLCHWAVVLQNCNFECPRCKLVRHLTQGGYKVGLSVEMTVSGGKYNVWCCCTSPCAWDPVGSADSCTTDEHLAADLPYHGCIVIT